MSISGLLNPCDSMRFSDIDFEESRVAAEKAFSGHVGACDVQGSAALAPTVEQQGKMGPFGGLQYAVGWSRWSGDDSPAQRIAIKELAFAKVSLRSVW